MTAVPPSPAAPATPSTPRAGVPHRGRTTVLALVVPTVIQAASLAVAWSWRADLPDPVATHWGAHGPDGFQSLTPGTLLVGGALALGLSVLFWAIGFFWGQVASTRRLSAGVGVGMSVLLAGLRLLTLVPQRGLADAAEVGGVGGALAVSFCAAIAAGALVAWLLVPGDVERPATAPVPATASRVPVPDGERAAWIARAGGGPGLWIFAVTTSALTVAAIGTQQWALLVISAALCVLGATMFVWVVRVDATGLDVRSAAGWPRTHVPAGSVESARARDVRPLKEFGGYGWRTAAGGTVGIILRGGEGLEVVHSGGRRLVVTVADAATGAALLNTMADRAR